MCVLSGLCRDEKSEAEGEGERNRAKDEQEGRNAGNAARREEQGAKGNISTFAQPSLLTWPVSG